MAEHCEHKLTRFFDATGRSDIRNFKPEHVVIVGAGAVTNSWDPLMEAFAVSPVLALPHSQKKLFYENKSFAAHALASQSFIYRSTRNHFARRLWLGEIDKEDLQTSGAILIKFCQLREQIGIAYVRWLEDKKIALRAEIDWIIKKYDMRKTAVITTNWDELLWNDGRFPNLIQLHGRASFPKSLILPTELTLDEEAIQIISIAGQKNKQRQSSLSRSTYKSAMALGVHCTRGSIFRDLREAHMGAAYWLAEARAITFWGIALNIYDAELNSVLFSSNSDPIPFDSVDVIDVNPKVMDVIGPCTLTEPDQIDFFQA